LGSRGPERPAASTNTVSRFETEVLTRPENLKGLVRLNARWVQQGLARTAHRRVIPSPGSGHRLDMDSSENSVHGEQEGAAYNGHLEALRARLYNPGERAVRDKVLEKLSQRFAKSREVPT